MQAKTRNLKVQQLEFVLQNVSILTLQYSTNLLLLKYFSGDIQHFRYKSSYFFPLKKINGFPFHFLLKNTARL